MNRRTMVNIPMKTAVWPEKRTSVL
jgi:hypothetical protein